MEKIDVKKELGSLYKPSTKKIDEVVVPEFHYLMIDGTGDPNTSEDFKNAVQTLFSLSYTIKFMIKKGETGIDYGVMPLEGLWWVDDMREFDVNKKGEWKWTVMIMQPSYVTKDLVEAATADVKKKKELKSLEKVRFESLSEGECVQVMHIGPFSEEGVTMERLHGHIHENNYKMSGKHHEIYLSDITKTAPERLKTIIRQPIVK